MSDIAIKVENLSQAEQEVSEKNIDNESDEVMFGKGSIPIILPRHLVQEIDTLEDWQRAEHMYQILNQDKKLFTKR